MAQTSTRSSAHPVPWLRWLVIGAVLAMVAAAVMLQSRWVPQAQQWLATLRPTTEKKGEGDAGHAAHGNPNVIELSPQARKNIGLTDDLIQPVKLQPFTRSLSVVCSGWLRCRSSMDQ